MVPDYEYGPLETCGSNLCHSSKRYAGTCINTAVWSKYGVSQMKSDPPHWLRRAVLRRAEFTNVIRTPHFTYPLQNENETINKTILQLIFHLRRDQEKKYTTLQQ
jgi:hypothetical protein